MTTQWTRIKRVVRGGFVGFLRNGFVSLSTILVMGIMLFVVGTLMLTNAALTSTLSELQNKVDINVYFLTSAPIKSVISLRDSVAALPEVASVEYITRAQALAKFQKRHKNDQLSLQALDELGSNPFGASLSIKAKQTSQYGSIAKFLQSQSSLGGKPQIIENINYLQNKVAIDKLSSIIVAAHNFGIIATLFLIFASILVVFNTIRLAIFTTKEEIGIMQLVGASDWYIQGPFIVEGALYGFVGGLIALAFLYPISFILGPPSQAFLGVFNVFSYYINNFGWLFFVLTGIGILLGALSSFVAVRRYLRRKLAKR